MIMNTKNIACSLLVLFCLTGRLVLADSEKKVSDSTEKTIKELQSKGIQFLRNSQSEDGSWTVSEAPGPSGLATISLLRSGLTKDDSTVKKALAHLETFIRPDGGIYAEKSTHRNYETCIVLLAFHEAKDSDKYKSTIENAKKFLLGIQWDEGEGIESSDTAYGGQGYGSHQRPDLSNTQFFVEAARTAGIKPDDPALQKALLFISRSQNLSSDYNTTEFSGKVNDGGFYYTPAAGGTSQAGTTANGGLRSYGSMTYAGLKSMIYAGLKSDDPRVKAAFSWIQKNYTLSENPGMGQQGLFYYYHTFAKALSIYGIDELTDEEGNKHNWREDLVDQLSNSQKENGSWVNKAPRWYEGDPNMATAYSLMALSYCH